MTLLATNPAFRRYWLARLASYAGDQIAHTALLIAVFAGRGGTALGLLLLAGTLPRLAGPLLGALADRYPQRPLMVACDLGQAALYLLLALTMPALPVLLVVIAAATTLATIYTPSGRSLLPRMVGTPQIPAANAQLAVAVNAGIAAGPALGGLLLAWLGLSGTLLVNVVTFTASAALIGLHRIHPVAEEEPEPAEDFGAGLRAGLAVVRSDPVVRAVCAVFFLSVMFAALDNVAVIPLGLTNLNARPALVGLLGTAYGIGMILAPLLLSQLLRRPGLPATRVLYTALAGFGAGTLLTGASPVLGMALAGQALAGAGNGWENVANDTLIQQHVPRHRLGTVFGTVYTFPYAAAALAYGLGAPLLNWAGPRWVLALSGTGVLLTLALAYPMLSRRMIAPGPDTAVATSGPS
ncbi:MAG TPA: MFS transporter [Rugosimonospora sp.]|nr:MFS transporter [Rugosimonospora sp.]